MEKAEREYVCELDDIKLEKPELEGNDLIFFFFKSTRKETKEKYTIMSETQMVE